MRPLGINTWVWASPLTDEVLPGLVDTIATLGFDAIELPLENVGDLDPALTSKVVREAGLATSVVGAMAPGRDLVATDPGTISSTQDYLRACIDLAVAVGADSVCGPFYAATGRTWRLEATERAAAYDELRSNLEPVVDYAVGRGVRLGIEPLNRYETSLINTVEQALTALGPLLGPGLGLALDTYHLHLEERSMARAIRAAGEHLVHVQVCGNDRGAPGNDQIDWRSVVTTLNEIGYDGHLTIESFTPDNVAIAVAASIWRPLADSPEALAGDGLAFLRRLNNPNKEPVDD